MKTNKTELKNIFGSLWNIYSKKTVYEIIIDSYNEVYVIEGVNPVHVKAFKSQLELEKFTAALFKFTKRKVIENEFSYFMKLDEFTMVNVILPPIAMKGPSLVILKLPPNQVTLDDLIEWKALTAIGKEKINSVLNSNRGFIVSGGIGSGKTTLLNTLVDAIPLPNRVVTLERTANLVIRRPFVCRLQSQTQRADEMIKLIGSAEQMRADYVVLSESIGAEIGAFLEMIRSNCTGVMLMTAESALDALKILETKVVLSSDGYSLEEARYAIAQSLPYLIFQEKKSDGKRVVSSIHEIVYDAGELKLKEFYKA